MQSKVNQCMFALLLFCQGLLIGQTTDSDFTFEIDVLDHVGAFDPVYAWFGYDEPNYTYMRDGRKLLREIADLSPVPVYVRTHNMLTTGDGKAALKWGSTNAYTEDEDGNPIYDWTLVDSITDTYIALGLKPLMEIGFMPEALSSQPVPYRHSWTPDNHYSTIFTGWAYPPTSYEKWAELVYQWVLHAVERYGVEEVESWKWEPWNEPNIGYWQGTTEEYIKLYDYTADAVKRALPTATVGGPHTTGPAWDKAEAFLRQFLEHCVSGTNYVTGQQGSPLDFIAFHAKGSPEYVDGRVVMNLGKQLRDVSKGFEIVASYPELKEIPIVIGESDPEGCAACSMDVHPHNGYRNGTMYPSYTAAAFARKIDLAKHFDINFQGAVTWAFEFENQPWFHGFRDLATNGVNKPVLNVFRMFGMMGGNQLKVKGDWNYDYVLARDSSIRESSDVGILSTTDADGLQLLVWHYHDIDEKSMAEDITIHLSNLPVEKLQAFHYRIDEQNSNAYELWKSMGQPQNPTEDQYLALEKAGQLTLYSSPSWNQVDDGQMTLQLNLPRHSVSLIDLRW